MPSSSLLSSGAGTCRSRPGGPRPAHWRALSSGRGIVAGSEVGRPGLTLIRRLDRRLVFAALASDRAVAVSPRKRLVLDLLGSLGWNASADERGQAEQALAHSVPSIEAFVWRPADPIARTVDQVLR